MGSILPAAALAMQTVGGLTQSIGASRSENAAAAIDAENARLSLLAGEQDVGAIRRAERRAAGDALTEMAGSGIAVGTGSAADVIAASAKQAELDIAARRTQAMGEQRNYLMSADQHRVAARNAIISGAFNAISGVLAGANDMRNRNLLQTQLATERRVQLGGSTVAPPRTTSSGFAGGYSRQYDANSFPGLRSY